MPFEEVPKFEAFVRKTFWI